jgi:hypothetical protein
MAPSVSIPGCNSLKSGRPTSIFEHDPQQLHGWNRRESLVWLGMRACMPTSGTKNYVPWCLIEECYGEFCMFGCAMRHFMGIHILEGGITA